MIPRKIHYCWFGRGKKSDLIEKCIASWKKYLPEYEIKEWNEDDFDISSVRFVKEAYEKRKWAFVTDFVRLYALHTEGGIYLDSDVEVLKPLERFLVHPAFTGFEMPGYCLTGIMASEKGGAWVYDMLKEYYSRRFILPNGKLNTEPNLSYATKIMHARGADLSGRHVSDPGYVEIYPRDFFCPKRHEDGKIVITENTYTIHHFAGSWLTKREKIAKWVGQHTHPMAEYWIKYFWRNPKDVCMSLWAAVKRRIGKRSLHE